MAYHGRVHSKVIEDKEERTDVTGTEAHPVVLGVARSFGRKDDKGRTPSLADANELRTC